MLKSWRDVSGGPIFLHQMMRCLQELMIIHQTPDVLAPAFTTWGWSDGIAEGFGYSGPMPWYALATMFHAEAGAACQEPLACSLFHSFLAAGRAYAASLRDALKSVRMRDRILRRLYAEALVQRLLHGPLPS